MTTEKITEEILTSFYCAYWTWLKDGAPAFNENDFASCYGLCQNLVRWGMRSDIVIRPALKLMKEQFFNAGLDIEYPFGGAMLYCEEQDSESCHTNQYRRLWVYDHTLIAA